MSQRKRIRIIPDGDTKHGYSGFVDLACETSVTAACKSAVDPALSPRNLVSVGCAYQSELLRYKLVLKAGIAQCAVAPWKHRAQSYPEL